MSKPQQRWYVQVLGVTEDPNKAHQRVYPVSEVEQPELQQARPRNRRDEGELEVNLPRVNSAEYGFMLARNNVVTLAFTSHEAAKNYAQQEAKKNPMTQYGVFGCGEIYETTAPTVIEKQFNASGELILKETEKQNVGA